MTRKVEQAPEAAPGVSAGTSVRTNDKVEVPTAPKIEHIEEKLGNGTVARTYVGLAPNAVA